MELPYVFDLLHDIKYQHQLKDLLETYSKNINRYQELIKLCEDYNIKTNHNSPCKIKTKFDNYFAQFDCKGLNENCDVKDNQYPWECCEYYWACNLLWQVESEES